MTSPTDSRLADPKLWRLAAKEAPAPNRSVLGADKYGQVSVVSWVDHPIMGWIWRQGGGHIPPPIDYATYTTNVIAWTDLPGFP